MDEKGQPTGGWDLQELRTTQDWYVRYALMSADGVSEVASVGGHVKEYQDGDNEFAGSELFYDHDKSTVEIWGDESQPCYFNGVLVDEIEIDLKTGRVKGRVPVPGTLQTDNR